LSRFNIYQIRELKLYKNFGETLAEYNYELQALKSDKPAKPSNEPPLTIFEILQDIHTQIHKMGFNADEMRLIDAKTKLELQSRSNLMSNLLSLRSQLNSTDRAMLDIDIETFKQENYDIDLYKRMMDINTDRLREKK
jgi:hypothetical protein